MPTLMFAQKCAAPPTAPAQTAPCDDVAPPIVDAGAVTPKPKKTPQRVRQRRRIEAQAAEIEQLKAELATARANPTPGEDVASLRAELESVRADRDRLAGLLELALGNRNL